MRVAEFLLASSLEAFGCSTWQEKSYDRTIDESNRHGLAAKTYDYIFIDTMLLDSFEQLQTIQRLQPQAQVRRILLLLATVLKHLTARALPKSSATSSALLTRARQLMRSAFRTPWLFPGLSRRLPSGSLSR